MIRFGRGDGKRPAGTPARPRRVFLAGVLVGAVLVFGARWVVNRTTFADWFVSPLLTTDTTGNADAMVVLGAGVTGDCVPNLNAVRRVLLGARLWRQGRAPIMLFTGASGPTSCPVSIAMAQLARDVGIPDASIVLESQSLNTHENGEKGAVVLHRLGARSVLLVTDRLHMRRSAGVFAALGFEVERASVPIYEGHENNVSMLAAGARELVALVYYRAKGWSQRDIGPHEPAQERPVGTGLNRRGP